MPKTLHFKTEEDHRKYESFRHIHGRKVGRAPKGQRHIIESTGRVHHVKSRIRVPKGADRFVK